MGKFTIVKEEADSPTSAFARTEAAENNVQQESASDSVDTFTLKTTQPTKKRRAPSARAKVTASTLVDHAAASPANTALWAQVLIGSANTVVVTWLGTECTMEKREAEMLEPPLARMLSRMPAGQAEQFSKFVDPMVMLIALGMWGNRIVRIQRAKRGVGISQDEFDRSIGVRPTTGTVDQSNMGNGREATPARQSVDTPVANSNTGAEPPLNRVEVNPNGVPTAITSQMGEL